MEKLTLELTFACDQEWDELTGTGSRRHCAQCDKHLVNLSLLTEKDAYAFVQKQAAEDSFCAMFEHKNDTIIFKQEPIQRTLKASIAAAALGLPLLFGCQDGAPPVVAQAIEVSPAIDPVPTQDNKITQGSAAMPQMPPVEDEPSDPGRLNSECDEEQRFQQIEKQEALISYQESQLFYIYEKHSLEGNLSKLDAIQIARNKRNGPRGGKLVIERMSDHQ